MNTVYQDDVLLVVDKPANLPSQRTRAGEDGVYEQLCQEHAYVGLHHRLDRRASGLLVFTLQRSVNKRIAKAFRKHAIQRTYLALCEGDVVADTWEWPVDGQTARTDVEVVGPRPDGVTEICCRLHTGRTHQIRIHAAFNGTPLVGDRTYGGDTSRRWDRLGLHAAKLSLTHPVTGVALSWSSATPW